MHEKGDFERAAFFCIFGKICLLIPVQGNSCSHLVDFPLDVGKNFGVLLELGGLLGRGYVSLLEAERFYVLLAGREYAVDKRDDVNHIFLHESA